MLKSDTRTVVHVRALAKMRDQKGTLRKVATELYRFSTSGIYFAHVRIHGKLFRQSLETIDRDIANQKLAEFRRKQSRINIEAGRLTVAELCDRYAHVVINHRRAFPMSKGFLPGSDIVTVHSPPFDPSLANRLLHDRCSTVSLK